MDHSKLAKEILTLVGGEQNVTALVHCTTRLRFKLKNREKANKAMLKKLPNVIQVMEMAGQFQIVIGPDVNEVYREIMMATNLDDVKEEEAQDEDKESFFNRAIDVISSIFTPLLGAMAGVGILKGLLILAVDFGWIVKEEGTYQILHAAADSLFYFMPILLAITSARKFRTDPYISVVIAGALLYPDLIEIYNEGLDITFLGLPIFLTNYSTSVIPIIIAVYVMSKIQPIINKWFHSSIRTFFTPLFLIATMVPLTLLVFGPFGTIVSKWLGIGYSFLYEGSPFIAGAIVGFFWQILVIFGLHWGLVPIAVNNLSQFGLDTFAAMLTPAIFAQAGSTLGVWLKTRNKQVKAISGPATFAGVLGITEPAIYGITLRFKKPFIIGCIGGAVGGAIVGVSGAAANSVAVPGLTTLPVYFGQGFPLFIIAIIIAVCIAAIGTFLFGYRDEEDDDEIVPSSKAEHPAIEDSIIYSPLAGAVIPLEQVEDEVFSSGAIGGGVAIIPTEGKLFSPVNGVVTSIFPSNHAFGITSDAGIEILIHIGMNTVQLGGKDFDVQINKGDKITKGQLLATFDIMGIVRAGCSITTPIVITNSMEYLDVISSEAENVEVGERLITIVK
ncbi:beta-glucoside-specific PTS transporter subunit IIABC [Metabacillus niabensis]|uniref:beta-glucoside-specific PTS transporter subunit IIABC n=1 Tax=Metabacillus niabensis TaxID=324854 RepID=UPI00399F8943